MRTRERAPAMRSSNMDGASSPWLLVPLPLLLANRVSFSLFAFLLLALRAPSLQLSERAGRMGAVAFSLAFRRRGLLQ